MTGVSIEATLELWASSLRDVKGRMRGLFTQERVAASASYLPDGTEFATKPALAVEMIERAIAADAVYGVGDVE